MKKGEKRKDEIETVIYSILSSTPTANKGEGPEGPRGRSVTEFERAGKKSLSILRKNHFPFWKRKYDRLSKMDFWRNVIRYGVRPGTRVRPGRKFPGQFWVEKTWFTPGEFPGQFQKLDLHPVKYPAGNHPDFENPNLRENIVFLYINFINLGVSDWILGIDK